MPPGSLRRSRAGQTALFTAAAFGLAYVCVLFMALPALPIMWLWLWAVEHDAAWLALFVNIAALPLLIAISCLWVALLKAMLLWRAAPGIYDLYSLLLSAPLAGLWTDAREPRASPPCFHHALLAAIDASAWGAHRQECRDVHGLELHAGSARRRGRAASSPTDAFLVAGARFADASSSAPTRSAAGASSATAPCCRQARALGDNCLLGVLSVPPSGIPRTPEGTDWLGSPAFELPNRHKVGGFDERLTFRPTPGLYVQRAAH